MKPIEIEVLVGYDNKIHKVYKKLCKGCVLSYELVQV